MALHPPRLLSHPAVVSQASFLQHVNFKITKTVDSWHTCVEANFKADRCSWKMKATSRKLLFFVQFLLPYFSKTEFCHESQGSNLYNQVLIGHGYKPILTRGILNCGQRCLADTRCTSYNYQTSAIKDGVCELNENRIVRKELFVLICRVTSLVN